ncbi:hypothetical protein VTK73DRAFT_9613 [Phialemonium thermophilum]|uniref:CENP-V/GFA domain-containing protein n=1 Tax=Phialemonium thermophilum TaxID=223376 RepID=A0ABR3XJM3_9PEZI
MSDPKPVGLPISCQCGYIRFRTPTPKPLGMAHCHCTECRKQSGSAFGTSAYFPANLFLPLDPDVADRLATCTRPADSGNILHCYFCPRCGVRLFHIAHFPDGRRREIVSVRAGCIEDAEDGTKLDWSGVKHVFMRSAVMKIPPEWEQYDTWPAPANAPVNGSSKQ